MTAQQIYVLKNKNKVASQKKKERDQKKAKKPIADYVSRRQGLAIVPEQSEVSSVKEVSLSKLEISEVELSDEQSSAPDKSIVEVPTVVPEVQAPTGVDVIEEEVKDIKKADLMY